MERTKGWMGPAAALSEDASGTDASPTSLLLRLEDRFVIQSGMTRPDTCERHPDGSLPECVT